MSRLPVTVATWDYDRVRPLIDGRVQIEGCDVNYLTMPVEECFERAYFHGEFEVGDQRVLSGGHLKLRLCFPGAARAAAVEAILFSTLSLNPCGGSLRFSA